MKKAYYVLCAFLPALFGCIYNVMFLGVLGIPILGSLITYALPFALLFFWFWFGQKCAQLKMPALCAILIGNSVGILSLLLYLWQFILLSGQQRNLFLASCSQLFSSALAFLTAKVAILFETQKDFTGSATFTGVQIIGLLVMIIVFTVGYFYKKASLKR